MAYFSVQGAKSHTLASKLVEQIVWHMCHLQRFHYDMPTFRKGREKYIVVTALVQRTME